MGLYDREYGRNDYGQAPGIRLDGPRSLTTNLVLLTFGIYLLQIFTNGAAGDSGWITEIFSLQADALTKPWLLFEFLSYGFLHDPNNITHILFNMIGVWMFGRVVEQRYGRTEFLSFYLAAIIAAGATWYAGSWLMHGGQLPNSSMLGASGGLSALLILFVFNFPKQMIYIWGVFPLPAWAFGLFFISQDIMGTLNQPDNVAYTAHLGGAAFGCLYFLMGWRISSWLPKDFSLPKPTRRSKLRIHAPDDDGSETDQQVDEILKKIQAEGQDSLTRRERRILEKASQEYQRKRR